MFIALNESEKQSYNPKGFCHAFKDYDGNPTNVYE
jgi:ubiquitin carboxyl-terminal hydrolase 9/24